jgi:hypothetical protein
MKTYKIIILPFLGYRLDDWGLKPQQGLGIFLFTAASRLALGPTQPPIQWVPWSLSLGVKQTGCEADHSPPCSAEVKKWVEIYLHSSICLHGMVLCYRHNTTLPLPFHMYV